MVGFGAARLASDQARTFDICRCSSWANAESKNFAWRCQAGSFVSGISGESAEGNIPARKRAVSSAVRVSAASAVPRAVASKRAAADAAILRVRSMSICDLEGVGWRRGRWADIVVFGEDDVDQKS